jgi:adenylyltransferase/sulfurtransferase
MAPEATSRVTVTLPRLLEPAVGSIRRVDLEASSVGEAIESLLTRHPTLRVHLFDEDGHLRQHVLCFVNGSLNRLEDRGAVLEGDTEITFLQAVSGGCFPDAKQPDSATPDGTGHPASTGT